MAARIWVSVVEKEKVRGEKLSVVMDGATKGSALEKRKYRDGRNAQ